MEKDPVVEIIPLDDEVSKSIIEFKSNVLSYVDMPLDPDDKSSVFTNRENQIQTITREIRQKMIESLAPDGNVPSNPKEIRLLNELLTAQESAINTRTNTRLKDKEISNNEVSKSEVVAILASINVDGKALGEVGKELSSGREFRTGIEVQTVEGHLDIAPGSIAEEVLSKMN